MDVVPNTWGETSLTRAWFRTKVTMRENSWRRTKLDPEAIVADSKDGAFWDAILVTL